VLYRSYPGDPGLQDYLRAAIADGILPIHVFVSTLLQAARSTELHIPATLDTLCRIALDAHYASGLPPLGSVVPLATAAAASVSSNPPFVPPPNSAHTGAGSASADATQMNIGNSIGTSVSSIRGIASGASDLRSPTAIMDTVQDALALLHTAYSLQMSHFHQLTTSAGELLVLLVSCVTAPGGAAAVPGTSGDSILSHATTAQALAHFADATELMRRYRLAPEAHRVLDSYLSALTLEFGDDVKAAREQQMMHSVQYALGKGDILGPSSDSDVISLGLLLNYMVCVALFRSCFRFTFSLFLSPQCYSV
jgi:mediator of RNA polymerase II transcription subunit 5